MVRPLNLLVILVALFHFTLVPVFAEDVGTSENVQGQEKPFLSEEMSQNAEASVEAVAEETPFLSEEMSRDTETHEAQSVQDKSVISQETPEKKMPAEKEVKDDTTVSRKEVTQNLEKGVSNTLPKGEKRSETLQQRIILLEEKLEKMEQIEAVRTRLKSTKQEEENKQEEILSSAGRDYTLMKPGILGVEYSIKYTGTNFDSILLQFDDKKKLSGVDTAKNSNHRITNALSVLYPLKDNFTVTGDFSFVARMNTESNTRVKDVTDLGDTVFGVQWQPVKSGGGETSKIINLSMICPTGRSPYKIDSTMELSTGSGGYSITAGLNMSKQIDPILVYGGFNYGYPFEMNHLDFKMTPNPDKNSIYLQSVEPGQSFSFSMGLAYSLSYSVSLNMGFQCSYSGKTRYHFSDQDGGVQESDGVLSSMINVSTGWNFYPKRKVYVKLGFGLTDNDPDFILSARIPFFFDI